MDRKEGEILSFIQTKNYLFQRYIGRGGTGETVLLKDEITNHNFICKKYSPVQVEYKEEFFLRFIDEIKIMYPLLHENIVRIYNYFLYPEHKTGYILMEYINGSRIDEFLLFEKNEVFESIFIQIIETFNYMEKNRVLHRDIRNENIMVTNDGVVKLIDFGFGKKTEGLDDDDKASIVLNWPVSEMPSEISNKVYDHKTEIYFIGKLYNKILIDNGINDFKYQHIINNMINVKRDKRINSFKDILREMSNERLGKENFTDHEKIIYRNLADNIIKSLSKIKNELELVEDPEIVEFSLNDLVDKCLLEETLQNNSFLINCFITNGYTYNNSVEIAVEEIIEFRDFFNEVSAEKQNIILSNLALRFSTIPVIDEDYDDIPF